FGTIFHIRLVWPKKLDHETKISTRNLYPFYPTFTETFLLRRKNIIYMNIIHITLRCDFKLWADFRHEILSSNKRKNFKLEFE
ncbi:hypothetical protein TNCT_568781, partial [Trichonephila clavata]